MVALAFLRGVVGTDARWSCWSLGHWSRDAGWSKVSVDAVASAPPGTP